MVGSVLGRLRRPEYTGENRCIQCTVVNALIAVVLAALVASAGLAVASPGVGGVAGGLVLLVAAGAIWLRGYLVPGTPTLTKRYFPDWVLGWFGKTAEPGVEAGVAAEPAQARQEHGPEVDPEETLMAIGALEECQGGEELCLTEAFRGTWYDEVRRLDAAEADRARLLELLDLDDAAVTYEEFEDGAFTARVDDRTVGRWESRAAFLADLGAANVLADRLDSWPELHVGARSRLLNGLRLFIDECPRCGGTPEFGTEEVESCCSTHDVAAVECAECDARLFESSPI